MAKLIVITALHTIAFYSDREILQTRLQNLTWSHIQVVLGEQNRDIPDKMVDFEFENFIIYDLQAFGRTPIFQ